MSNYTDETIEYISDMEGSIVNLELFTSPHKHYPVEGFRYLDTVYGCVEQVWHPITSTWTAVDN